MKSSLTILILMFWCMGMYAQSSTKVPKKQKVPNVNVQVTNAKYLGKTKPLRDLVPIGPTSKEKKAKLKLTKKKPANFIGRGKGATQYDESTQKPDPVRQTHGYHTKNTDLFQVELLVDREGLTTGSAPHDPTGDIGRDYYIQAVNATSFRVFDKEGTPVTGGIAANTLWADLGFTSAGDPIILYDQEVDRWIITEFPSGNQLLFAISETSDPTGSWDAYNFGTPNFPDYPKYSIWNDSYVVTTNESGAGQLEVYVINRQEILDVVAAPSIQRLTVPGISGGPGFFVATPVDWSGDTPPADTLNPMVLRLNDNGWNGPNVNDQVDIFSIDVDWDDPSNTSVTSLAVETADFNSNACAVTGGPGFACIPQLGGAGVDGLPQIIMNQPDYRNFGTHESIVLNFLVNAATPDSIIAGIRWVEMRKTPGTDWSVYQEGTYAPEDGLHRFNGSIAMDAQGNIALAYNVSSENDYIGIRLTGRRATDPLGEMTVQELNVVDGASPSNDGQPGRWGDYSHMNVDPIDQKTFWFTAEYQGPTNTRTKIISFQLTRDTTDIGVVAMNSPQSSPNLTDSEPIQIQVKNFGLDTQMVYSVGYIFENGMEVIENVNQQLLPDSIYTHTFASTVDVSVVGDYDFKLFTSLATDEAVFNDTLRTTVSKQPRNDAGITAIAGLDGTICTDSIVVQLELTNFGGDNLTSVDINVTLNGNALPVINWTGDLVSGASENVEVDLTGFINGSNNIAATVANPNGEMDETPSNDESSRDFNVILNGVEVKLLLNTDNFPDETTWVLADSLGNEILTGGPYPGENSTLITETWCLDPDACYNFTIFDSYGDGICCGFFTGNGNYSIVDANDLPLVISDGEFGSEESFDFCATFECSVGLDIDILNESESGAGNGAIFLTPTNGIAPYEYSLDGGQSFQSGTIFNSLDGGDYNVIVRDAADCIFETTVKISTCAIEITAEVVNESAIGHEDGAIEIEAVNGLGHVTFSLGGTDFVETNVFENLGTGTYTVFARDSAGCTTSLEVTIDIEVSLENVIFGSSVEVLPNPTEGLFRINVKGLNRADVFLPFHIYDVSGKFVYASNLVKYDDTYTSEVSLVAFPSGTYFIRFLDENSQRLVKVVKR